MTPQRQKDETIRALVDLVEAAARRDPVLVLFEDAHWADPTSLEVLDALVERMRQIADAAAGHPPAGVSAEVARVTGMSPRSRCRA